MTRGTPGVTARVPIELVTTSEHISELSAEFAYSAMDPFAVTAVFKLPSQDLAWDFSRDLLSDGVYEPSGEGDVRVWPDLDHHGRACTVLKLDSPTGSAVLRTPTRTLIEFLQATEALVPRGCEATQVAVDRFVTRLLPPEED